MLCVCYPWTLCGLGNVSKTILTAQPYKDPELHTPVSVAVPPSSACHGPSGQSQTSIDSAIFQLETVQNREKCKDSEAKPSC